MKTTTGEISISTDGGKCRVKSPYHPEFVTVARGRNGRWSSPHWIFDGRDEAGLRDECRRIYGTDGTPVSCVDCRVDVYDGMDFSGPSWVALGRVLVERKGRDDRAKLGEGVVVIQGGFPSWGGSVKNPRPNADSGTILEVRDVPVELARRWAAEHTGVTILEPETPAAPEPAPPSPPSPLAAFADADLAAELTRRGWTCTPGGHAHAE